MTQPSPTALPISAIIAMGAEYNAFQMAYNTAGVALQNVISTGTTMYNDPNFLAEFPETWVAYQTYLASLQTTINTFLAALPIAPALNG